MTVRSLKRRNHALSNPRAQLDRELADAIATVALRRGPALDQVIEQAVRQCLGPSVIDQLWERSLLDEDEATRIAVEEV